VFEIFSFKMQPILSSRLIITWTELQLQMDEQKVIQRDRCTKSHDSFFVEPLSSLLFIWVVFCIVVHELKQACPLKSSISLLARIHRRCVLYRKFMFELVFVFELTLTTEPSGRPRCN
jgi:hypothetical protein